MEHRDDRTVLIFSEKEAEGDYHSDEDFKNVIYDECDHYKIVTSIKNLVYRIEVYHNDKLEDAVEVSCENTVESISQFQEIYTSKHTLFKDKYCHKSIISSDDVEDQNHFSSEIKQSDNVLYANEFHSKVNIFKQLFKYIFNKRIKKTAVIVLSGLISATFAFKFFICTDVLDRVLSPSKLISYYTYIEPVCHHLEKQCSLLSRNKIEEKSVISFNNCKKWCDQGKISYQNCSDFDRTILYKSVETISIDKKTVYDQNESRDINNTASSVVQKKPPISMLPEGNIVLYKDRYFELWAENHTKSEVTIRVIDLILNGSSNEEIVQFRAGVSSLAVPAGGRKRFKIFLEKSYYQQFEKGEYTGKLLFMYDLPDKKNNKIEKNFSFKVEK